MTKWLGYVGLGVGVILILAGAFTFYQGVDAYNLVQDTLADERIITSADASIPQQPVDNAATAEAQANVIRDHVLESTGGKSCAELERDDPFRPTCYTSITLRTSLNLAVMGFRVAQLVQGIGVFVALVGVGVIVGYFYFGRSARLS